jgi:iron complex transport system substrate-binding protein
MIKDDRGKTLAIPARPTRIVVAGTPLFTEILFDIGAGERLVGVTDSPDNPPEAQNVPKVGPSLQPNVEQVIALKPDIVFGAVGPARDALEAAGLLVVTPIGFISQVSDILDLTRAVGEVVDACAPADALIGQISEAIVRLESRVLDRDRPTAAFLFVFPNSPPFAAGRGDIGSELLARAGGQNSFADVQGDQQVNVETLIARDPEFIFTDPSQIANITANPLLANLKAVKANHIIGIKASTTTSTRVAEALEAMARALHPQAFP